MKYWQVYTGLVVALLVVFGASAVAAPNPTASLDDSRDSGFVVSAMGAGWDATVTAYHANGTARWQHDGARSYNGVDRINETALLVAYQDKRDGSCPYPGECEETGVQILRTDGDEPRVAWEWSMPVRTGMNSEIHDAEMLPNGNILIADMDRERIMILSPSTKETVWQWYASQHYEAPADPTKRDWLHINDVDRIGDGRYLVSVRNANQLLILERGAGVVEVVNRDRGSSDEDCRGIRKNQLVADDARCGPTKVLDHQHNPQWLGDGRVLVADSENDRVVELQRGDDGQWTVAWTRYEANGLAFDWPRDADRLENGNTLVLDTRNARLVEIAPNGSVIYAQGIPEQGYDADVSDEYPAGPAYVDVPSQSALKQPIDTVGALYGGARHVAPWLPTWVTEWHLLATIIVVSTIVVTELGRAFASLRDYFAGTATDDPARDGEDGSQLTETTND